ncbi:MAG: cyclase family protein [Acidimicrobiales bacterium]
MTDVEAIARAVNNWGRWGPDDEIGTLNLITPAVLQRAAACVRTGKAIGLSLPLSQAEGIQLGFVPGRVNPLRTMIMLNTPHGDQGLAWNDDVVTMGLQAATHWDGLAHASWQGKLYNGYDAATVTVGGASKLGIGRITSLTTRGVLLDVARAKGVDALEGGYPITSADLDAALALTSTAIESGDAVLVRTGQMTHLRAEQRDLVKYCMPSPGLTAGTAPWFHDRDVVAVATDTLVFEVYPEEDAAVPLPVHRLHLVEMGMTQGQNWALDDLAADCAGDGVYEFLLEATPLPFTGACGSPVAPVAVK